MGKVGKREPRGSVKKRAMEGKTVKGRVKPTKPSVIFMLPQFQPDKFQSALLF